MSQLPPVVWAVIAVAVLSLLAACGATAYAVLRAPSRRSVARWPAWRVAAVFVVAWIPWLVVRLAPIEIEVKAHGVVQAAAWLLAGLAAFALLVLVPLAAVLVALVWWVSWRGKRVGVG